MSDIKENIYQISVDIEQLAYKLSVLEDEVAKISATVTEIKGENNESRRMVS